MNTVFRSIIKAKSLKKIILCGVLFVAMVSIASAQSLVPAIEIHPGTSVEVGEEVYFSATRSVFPDPSILAKARYEWDFGDGYYHRFDPSVIAITRSGIAVVHYYMKPGDFQATLKVSVWAEWDAAGRPIGEPLSVETTTRTIHVSGEAPMAGFEIQRAPFHNRLSQYLYVQIPDGYRRNETTLKVTLQGAKGTSLNLLSKNTLSAEEKVFLDHKSLVQDDYVVIAELINSGGERIQGGLWKDKFSKRYSGIPRVGIDENNSFRLNGELFFPIAPFMTDEGKVEKFVESAAINALNTEGYYPTHTPDTWSKYLDLAATYNLMAAGPTRGNHSSPARFQFNNSPDLIAEYVKLNKNKQAMLFWSWDDEPNMGARWEKVYPATLAAFSYAVHREDPNHPVYNLFYGYDWTRYFGNGLRTYDYLDSHSQFGGKKWMQDIFSFDIYPFQYRLHTTLNSVDMGPYAIYLDALDRIHVNNKNLVPVMPAIMPNPRNSGDPLISSDQVYMEAWMNVIHGAKSILWFPYFDYTNIRYDAMKKFAEQMKVLAPVVLQAQPERTVTDDANFALNRVDTMIREYNGDIYLFTSRITEPDPIEKALYKGIEPQSIEVSFVISGLSGESVADVVDEGRNISITNGEFTDTFEKNAVHIYRIASQHKLPNAHAPSNLRIAEDR